MPSRQDEVCLPLQQAGITSECLSGGTEVIDSLEDEWTALCVEGGCNVPFFRPEYFRAYVRWFESGRRYVITTARVQGRLVALLPLVRATESWYGIPVRFLTSPRGDHYMRFGLVCANDVDRQQICTSLLRSLKAIQGWDVLRLAWLRDDDPASGLMDVVESCGFSRHAVSGIPGPYVTLDGWHGDWDWFIAQRSSNFRHMMRKAKRKADAAGGIVLRRFEAADEQALQTFYKLEAAGWKGQTGTAINCQPHLQKFYREAAQAAAQNEYLTLYILNLVDQPIAGMYGFTLDGRFYAPKIGYDERFKEFAPGHLIVNEVLRDCANRGLHEFDFLGGVAPWKASWTSQTHPISLCYVFRNSVLSRLAERLHFSLRPIARRLYRRLRPTKKESRTTHRAESE